MNKESDADTAAFELSWDEFGDYKNVEEYISDIGKWLVRSTWHYSVEQADRIIDSEKAFICKSYSEKKPAGDVAMDIGYCCG